MSKGRLSAFDRLATLDLPSSSETVPSAESEPSLAPLRLGRSLLQCPWTTERVPLQSDSEEPEIQANRSGFLSPYQQSSRRIPRFGGTDVTAFKSPLDSPFNCLWTIFGFSIAVKKFITVSPFSTPSISTREPIACCVTHALLLTHILLWKSYGISQINLDLPDVSGLPCRRVSGAMSTEIASATRLPRNRLHWPWKAMPNGFGVLFMPESISVVSSRLTILMIANKNFSCPSFILIEPPGKRSGITLT